VEGKVGEDRNMKKNGANNNSPCTVKTIKTKQPTVIVVAAPYSYDPRVTETVEMVPVTVRVLGVYVTS
jgi:hypothetical protein